MSDATVSNFDSVVLNREGNPVALVWVKGESNGPPWTAFLTEQLLAFGQAVPFVLLVDPAGIDVFRWDGGALTGPVAHLRTADILRVYEPEYDRLRIFAPYLQTLTEAWLRDLAYHWKLERPPASDELRRAGLLDQFEGGTALSSWEEGCGRYRLR